VKTYEDSEVEAEGSNDIDIAKNPNGANTPPKPSPMNTLVGTCITTQPIGTCFKEQKKYAENEKQQDQHRSPH
jgi:hypothetical protein